MNRLLWALHVWRLTQYDYLGYLLDGIPQRTLPQIVENLEEVSTGVVSLSFVRKAYYAYTEPQPKEFKHLPRGLRDCICARP